MTCHSEKSLVLAVKRYAEKIGAAFYKNPPSKSGRPDIEVMKNNRVAIIETKKGGVDEVRVSQLFEIKHLKEAGCSVLVSNDIEKIKEFINATLQISES